jgi:GAF domain-containing protein
MDHYSILDETPSLAEQASASSGIAAANAVLTIRPETDLWPGDEQRKEQDAGQTLSEMARADLDAALQLLADRAQYITGATGAAIALRRGEKLDMLCRASTGSNAPGLGAVLSMDQGVSGECVRTRQPLRCDDVMQDPRVNQKACSRLGIASLVVTPIMSTDTVLGVFELFSGKPRSFGERDLSTLMRLSQLAETAIKYATAAHSIPQILEAAMREKPAPAEKVLAATAPAGSTVVSDSLTASPKVVAAELPATKEESKTDSTPRKPLLWFAALQIHAKIQEGEEIAPSVAPEPANLQKCQACGFPVSQGRNLCVECEEKKWRGQKIPVPSPSPKLAPQDQVPVGTVQTAGAESIAPVAVTAEMSEPAIAQAETPKVKREEALSKEARINEATLKESLLKESSTSGELSKELPSMLSDPLPPEDSAPALSLALESESWFAQNKVIVATIFVIAVIIAIVWLR